MCSLKTVAFAIHPNKKMIGPPHNKLKIFNDPVYGFINIPFPSVFDILEHPWFQRLRYIKQLGLTHLVYPGALHTRFHHALGAMHLVVLAMDTLKAKGHPISDLEEKATVMAILMHDIGHGPFSHALESTLVENLHHEQLSLMFMQKLKKLQPETIELAIEIFCNTYSKKFLHQLVSGQLDMDRLDYLNRDSFFTGVSEGVVSSDRIIKTLNVSDDNLVTDEKGIYSLEKFIIARRLMYWQVYLHKTVISAEKLLIAILQRAREIALDGQQVFATPPLKKFLTTRIFFNDFTQNPQLLDEFALLDDFDIFSSIKVWCAHPDKILSVLCQKLVYRRLFKVELQKQPFTQAYVDQISQQVCQYYGLSQEESRYFVLRGVTENNAYDPGVGNIWIMQKDGSVSDIAEISDQLNIRVLSKPVKKYYICYPKEVGEFYKK